MTTRQWARTAVPWLSSAWPGHGGVHPCPGAGDARRLPPLDVPAPPPRIVEPVVARVAAARWAVGRAAADTVPRPSRAPPTRRRTPPSPSRPSRSRRPSRPRPPKSHAAARRRRCRRRPAEQEAEARTRRSRTCSTRATADLNRVDYAGAERGRPDPVRQAKRFISQAEEALRDEEPRLCRATSPTRPHARRSAPAARLAAFR